MFACSFSPFGNGSTSSCGDTKVLKPYVGNLVTVGWYEQPEFLGFKNDTPQLVTIEMDNEIIRSYEQTYNFVTDMGNSDLYVMMPISAFSFPIFYWFFGWLSAVGERRRQVGL